MGISKRRHLFIGYFVEEALLYWLFERGGTILLSKFGRKSEDFFIYIQNYAGSWLELHFMVQALPGRVGRLDQVFFSGVA